MGTRGYFFSSTTIFQHFKKKFISTPTSIFTPLTPTTPTKLLFYIYISNNNINIVEI